MQRNHFKKKGYKQFLVKNKIGAPIIFKKFDFFLNFNFFHVFLVKLLNIILVEKNRNMHIFYKRKFQS